MLWWWSTQQVEVLHCSTLSTTTMTTLFGLTSNSSTVGRSDRKLKYNYYILYLLLRSEKS